MTVASDTGADPLPCRVIRGEVVEDGKLRYIQRSGNVPSDQERWRLPSSRPSFRQNPWRESRVQDKSLSGLSVKWLAALVGCVMRRRSVATTGSEMTH
jgi:hypothetical protein